MKKINGKSLAEFGKELVICVASSAAFGGALYGAHCCAQCIVDKISERRTKKELAKLQEDITRVLDKDEES